MYSFLCSLSIGKIPKVLTFNKSYLPQHLSNDEKSKHQSYLQKMNEQQFLETITNKLTPDDIRILVETEDEYTRRGNFVRVFPTAETKKYLRLFETPRYYNLLLHEWIRKYGNNSDKGQKTN
jgi:tubulin polyglutamylase TTLL4